jgi:ABC-type transport system involved in cytochrome c biogenesis permease subunit
MAELELSLPEKIWNLWPVVLPLVLAAVYNYLRYTSGPNAFLNEGALTMLALISYMSATVLLITNIFVKENILYKLGLITVSLGYSFNLGGWMMRWIEAGDKEGWKDGINGVWRYFPLDNLYSLTLGFVAGAALATLVIIRKPQYRFLGVMSLPILTIVLVLGVFLGNQITTLQPVLDSYWRPIHVSIATFGYGVCLVSFGLAFAYLLKDGISSESIAIVVALFGLLVFGTIGRFGVPIHQEYGVALFWGSSPLPVRANLPYVGPLMVLTLLSIIGALALFVYNHLSQKENARVWGWRLFGGALVLQAIVLIAVWVQIGNVSNEIKNPQMQASLISEGEYAAFGQWLGEQMRQDPDQPVFQTAQNTETGRQWLVNNAAQLSMSHRSNPVELGGLFGLFVLLLMTSIFAWKRKEVMSAMPALQTIDSLLYRSVGVAFPLLTLLLITGAVWANESWGRYWGWDSKETGALVAWMAYAGFLHTRISHGWRGRRSAYFALLGFSLVIFTWLGVSYLLPGLHSYAG